MLERKLQNATWVCNPCGVKYGKRIAMRATYHYWYCDVCWTETSITEPRDFWFLSQKNVCIKNNE